MDVVSTIRVTKRHPIDGGQGQNSLGVYCAFDPQLNTDVALKEIAKTGFRDPASFFAEAQRMFGSEHPNVVPIRTASQTKNSILLVMPLYKKGSLQSLIENGPLSIGDTIRMGREILAGVGAIHAGGSVHFDIKPSNILISDNGVARVSDFGQARELGPDGVTLMPQRMYAPLTPPEAFTDALRGTRLSDIFQVGATLYRAVNGEKLFNDQFVALGDRKKIQDAIVAGKFPRRDRFLPHVPDRLRRVIRKAMSVVPTQRFHNAHEFSNALTKVLPTHNWSIRQEADKTTWETDRVNQPNLCVVLRSTAPTFGVALYTMRKNILRATKKGFWKDDLRSKDADRYLTQLFAALA